MLLDELDMKALYIVDGERHAHTGWTVGLERGDVNQRTASEKAHVARVLNSVIGAVNE